MTRQEYVIVVHQCSGVNELYLHKAHLCTVFNENVKKNNKIKDPFEI